MRKIVVDPAARSLSLSCGPARSGARPLDTQVFALALTALYSLLRQGVVLHAAGLKTGRGAFLLAGPSGSGKSTLSAYCAGRKGAVVLNDEKTIVDRKFRLYGTPWSGSAGLRSPESAPLKGIFFLEKGKRNEIRPLSRAAAFSLLMQCLWAPYGYRQGMEFCADFLMKLLDRVPFYSFTFRKSPLSACYLLGKVRRP